MTAHPKIPHPDVLEYIKLNYYCKDGAIYNRYNKEVCFVPSPNKGKPRQYCYLQVGPKTYKRSHVVWFLSYGFWPRLNLLHKDGNRLNDNIENLEETTVTDRMSRRAGSRQYKGFSIYQESDKLRNPWRAKNYKYRVDLGYFETEEAAKAKVDEYQRKGCQWWPI